MKKNLLTALLLFAFMGVNAQLVEVVGVDKVNLPEKLDNKVAAISPDGTYLLVTTDYNKGLARYDLQSGDIQTVTDAQGAGYDVKISADGRNIVYRENSFTSQHLKMVAVCSHDLATGKNTRLAEPSRELQAVAVEGTSVLTVNSGKSRIRALGKAASQINRPVLSIDRLHLMLTRDGVTTEFSPLGADQRYIWPSVSPDGKRALFYVSGNGAYICNLDGTGLKALGQVRAPRWYNNDIVVGMNDKDDGRVYTSSSIIAVDLDGNTQTLTDDSVIAMYPMPDAKGDKIAFSTPMGEAYIINVNTNK